MVDVPQERAGVDVTDLHNEMTSPEGVVVDNAGCESTDCSQNSNDPAANSGQVQTSIDKIEWKWMTIFSKYPKRENGLVRIKMLKKREMLVILLEERLF